MKHLITASLLALLAVFTAAAQDCQVGDSAASKLSKATSVLDVNVLARGDWQNTWQNSKTVPDASGFEGKYLMLRVDGQIVPGMKYSWRQRFNKTAYDSNFFDATDWLTISWEKELFSLAAGKEIVAIGGWEYDRNPADIYAASLFWQNVACYQWGVSGALNLKPRHTLMGQITQSMFHTSERRNLYGYNFMYTGAAGPWQAMYSLNLTEYAPGHYINYLSLGNRMSCDKFTLELDLMNRYASHQVVFGRDMSVIAELAWSPSAAWRIAGKYTYDVNRTHSDADTYVHAGTEMNMAGGCIEFFPLKTQRSSLRLHAGCWHMWGENTDSGSSMQDGTTFLSCGVTWNMNVLSLKRNR